MPYSLLHRRSESAPPSVIRPRLAARPIHDISELQSGWEVVDDCGTPVGTVARVESDWVVVAHGVLRRSWYVPVSAVRLVVEGRVTLNLEHDEIAAADWGRRPRTLR